MTNTPETRSREAIEDLLDIMKRLRDPVDGCPWDTQQTFGTIAPYTIEEAYEVADAIERKNFTDLKEELGDLLLQVVFHAQMASEENLFSFDDVVKSICEKMIRRHPHVFGNEDASRSDDVSNIWEREKDKERHRKADGPVSLLADVPVNLPSLLRAVKLQKRAAKVGFDWPSTGEIFDKLDEELRELQEEVGKEPMSDDRIEDEMGDVLFVVTNLARKLHIDPDAALRRCNEKFRARFQYIEHQAQANGLTLEDVGLDQMEAWWQEAKTKTSS